MKRALLLLALLAPLAASAEVFSVADNNQTRTFQLHSGDVVSVSGNNNVITIQGSGQAVTVSGNENQVKLDAALQSVNLTGNRNAVVVVPRKGRKEGFITHVGRDNDVQYQPGP